MPSRSVTICNKLGLHARAASKLAQLANQYAATIQLRYQDRLVDAKSIMSLMLLAACQGTEVELLADGLDADSALNALCALIDNRFDEGE
jgi:phosphocarrier protein HPr